MSQQLREFVKQSGVEVRPPNTNSPSSVSTTASNNALAREIEMDLGIQRQQEFPRRLERNIMSNENYGEFAQFVHNSNNDNNTNNIIAMAQREPTPVPTPPKNIQFVVSKLNPGMFNATVNKQFNAETRIDLRKILLKTPLPKTSIGEGLYVETKEINGIYGRFLTGFTHTKEYGKQGDLNKAFFTVQLKIIVSDGTSSKGATVNFYRNGKIRFSGGFIGENIANQPELIRRFIVNSYSERQDFLYNPFEYNNLSGQFRVNGIFKNMDELASRHAIYGFSYISYNSELSPFMYVTYNHHKYILAKTCNFQISGAKNPSDMLQAYNSGVELARTLYENDEIMLTASVPTKLTKTQPRAKPKAKPKAKAKTTKTKKTRPLNTAQRSAIKVDGKQCMRMSKPELVDLAKKLGVVGITKSSKKEDICNKIKKITNTKTATFKNTNKKKNVTLSGTGKSFKVGRVTCANYSKAELLRVAGILKIKLDPKETKATLCKKIEKVRNNKVANKAKPKTPPPPKPTRKEVAQKKKNVKKQEVIKKRGLDENSIRKDITKLYGKRWMTRYKNVMPSLNNDVREMKSRLNKLKTGNKLGVPFKRDVDLVKKRLVNRWKSERERELEKKVIMRQINVNGVPKNLVNQYRKAATNYIMSQGPTAKQLQSYKKTWINLRNKR